MQVLLILHADIFDKIPFFKDKHPQFLEQLIPCLKLEVRIRSRPSELLQECLC